MRWLVHQVWLGFFFQEVDNELKTVCEQFIDSISSSLVSPLKDFLSKVCAAVDAMFTLYWAYLCLGFSPVVYRLKKVATIAWVSTWFWHRPLLENFHYDHAVRQIVSWISRRTFQKLSHAKEYDSTCCRSRTFSLSWLWKLNLVCVL